MGQATWGPFRTRGRVPLALQGGWDFERLIIVFSDGGVQSQPKRNSFKTGKLDRLSSR